MIAGPWYAWQRLRCEGQLQGYDHTSICCMYDWTDTTYIVYLFCLSLFLRSNKINFLLGWLILKAIASSTFCVFRLTKVNNCTGRVFHHLCDDNGLGRSSSGDSSDRCPHPQFPKTTYHWEEHTTTGWRLFIAILSDAAYSTFLCASGPCVLHRQPTFAPVSSRLFHPRLHCLSESGILFLYHSNIFVLRFNKHELVNIPPYYRGASEFSKKMACQNLRWSRELWHEIQFVAFNVKWGEGRASLWKWKIYLVVIIDLAVCCFVMVGCQW